MRIGTKSLLFGCHQVILHPLFVLWAWVKLYSWPNWKELACIVIHDWGYLGSPNMDGKEGEQHPVRAAVMANKYLDRRNVELALLKAVGSEADYDELNKIEYYELCLFHSRYYAKSRDERPSKLCWADKLGTVLMPAWLWVGLGSLSGEIAEYMTHAKYERDMENKHCPYTWFEDYRAFVDRLLEQNCIQGGSSVRQNCGLQNR